MLKNIEKTHKSAFFYENIWSYQKKAVPLHSLSKRKCGILKNGAVVQLVRIHACHAWGRGFESRPHRKKEMQSASLFCGIRTARTREYAQRRSRVRVPSAPQEAIREGCFFFCFTSWASCARKLFRLQILAA